MKYYFNLTTVDPVIMSQSTATTNNHQCLDFIPGSAILGMIAAELYTTLTADDAWTFFHSGQIQYGPCYPVIDGELALPIPNSWHYPKGFSLRSGGQYNPHVISNHADTHFVRDESTQYKQCRQGFITANGAVSHVDLGFTTKTAIDREQGKAKNGSLFSYSYIRPNQMFCGWVEYQTEQQLALINQVLLGVKHIGRSRNSEFGRVRIEKAIQPIQNPIQANTDNRLTIWCLSDSECIDEYGQPTLTPSLANLVNGASGRFNPHHSFVRQNIVSLFNQKRGGLDSEQRLIAKGSVLVFDDVTITTKQLLSLTHNGVGINRQQGLGWVMINPAWSQSIMSGQGTLFEPLAVAAAQLKTASNKPTAPCSPLTRWVESQIKQNKVANQQEKQANDTLKAIVLGYLNARQYNAIINAYEVGPSHSQWRRVTDVFKNDITHWQQKLFSGEHAICKPTNDELGWGVKWDTGDELVTFAQYCENHFTHHTPSGLQHLLEQLCRYDLSTYKGIQQACKELHIDMKSTAEVNV
jgi:CRISPR-associated protein Csx10